MKFFLITACVFAVASADVSHLLNVLGPDAYNTQSSSSSSASSSSGSGIRQSFGGNAGGISAGSANVVRGESGYLDYSSGSSGGVAGRIIKPVIVTGAPIVSKAFYLHETAAEEAAGVNVETREHVVRPRKHYNIVFVKAPVAGSSSINSNNVNVFPENEEKTIVYVLTGRNDGVEVNDNGEIQLPQPKTPSKPEVVFVRYNSENDAQRAISDIQNQYNSQSGASVSVIGAGNRAPIRSGVSTSSSSSSSSSAASAGAAGGTHPIRSVNYD